MSKLNLVTGANGHLGNNLVRTLLDMGEQVRASVRNPKNTLPFEGLDCEIVQADLMDKDSLLRALEGVDTLYSFCQNTNQLAGWMNGWNRRFHWTKSRRNMLANLIPKGKTRNTPQLAAGIGF